MTKFDTAYRRRVVRSYLDGEGGYKAVGDKYGVSRSVVRRWVNAFGIHGEIALRAKHSCYSAEFKRSVLERIQRDELSHVQAAVLFDLRGGAGVISRWRRQYHEGGFEALKPKPKGRPRMMKKSEPMPLQTAELSAQQDNDPRTLKQVLKENEYLRAEVAYLKKWRALIQEKDKAAQKKRG